MSADGGYMLIRVDLQGAREAAGEAAALRGEIAGTGTAVSRTVAPSTRAAKAGKALGAAWQFIGKAAKFGAFALAGAIGIVGLAAKSAISNTQELAKSTLTLNANLDMGVKQASRWANVTMARGIDMKGVGQAFGILSANIDKASQDAKGTQADLFTRLGIGKKDLKRAETNFTGFVTKFSKGLGEMGKGPERVSTMKSLLGRGWMTISPLLRDGSKALQEQLDLVDKYHATFSKQQLDQQKDLLATQRESKIAWAGMQHSLAEVFTPALMDANKEFQTLAEQLTDPSLSTDQKIDILSTFIQDKSRMIGEFLQDFIPKFAEQMGQNAPKIALAFVNGFIGANVWGKLVLGYWLISKLTAGPLLAKIAAAGGKAGLWFAKRFIVWVGTALLGEQGVTSLATIFAADGKLAGKVGPASRVLGSKMGRMFGLGFITFGGLIFADEIQKWIQGNSSSAQWAREALGLSTTGGPTGDPLHGTSSVVQDPSAFLPDTGSSGPNLTQDNPSPPGYNQGLPPGYDSIYDWVHRNDRRHKSPSGKRGPGEAPTGKVMEFDPMAATDGDGRTTHIILDVDGKKLAEVVHKEGTKARSRK